MNKKTELELDLAFGIKRIGILLESGVNFYDALKIVSKEKGEFSIFLKKIIKQIDNGRTVEDSFRIVSSEYNSNKVKRVSTQIISAYKSGSKGTQLKRVGKELLLKQEHELKKYSSKSAVYGLLFVILSVIVPTLLIVLYFVGSFAFSFNLTAEELIFGILIFIPLLSISLLYFSRKQADAMIYQENKEQEFLFLGLMLVLSFLSIFLGVFGILLIIFVGGYFIYKNYKKEKKIENLEKNFPDLLMHLSGMDGSSFGSILKQASNGYGELSNEMKKSYNQFKSNIEMEKILNDLEKRVDSEIFSKTVFLFKYVIESNNFVLFAQMAEDVLRYFEIKREKESIMTMQKYTLILGSLIIPLILGMVSKMAENISQIMEISKNSEIIFNSIIPSYLIIYSIISGAHIIGFEQKRSDAMIYTVVMVCAGLGIYYIMLNV